MESMTGYAFVEKSTEQFSFSIEIKSLNSRYLETYINVPKILRHEESELQTLLKNSLIRGKVELSIDIFDWTETKPITLNADLIEKYYNELMAIKTRLKISDTLPFESVLNLDGISQRERSEISAKSRRDIHNSVAAVIKKAIKMRIDEGTAIKKDIAHSISEIVRMSAVIKASSKDNTKERKDVLKKRIGSLTGSHIDENRLLTELAIIADKLDINEEIVRLKDHIKKFKIIMNEKEQIGRKLDFLAQEMFREINTIGAKSNSSEISHIVVELKNHIDKIREHCRNIV